MNIVAVKSLCPKVVEALEAGDFTCEEIRYQGGQRQYVFKRDLWDAFEVIVSVGDRNDKFADYCLSGNVEAIA